MTARTITLGAIQASFGEDLGANIARTGGLIREAAARGARVYYPRPEFCTDNAAMIAVAGLRRLQAGERWDERIQVWARWPLTELSWPV